LLVAVDHDTGRLIYAAVGANKKTLNSFFDLIGDERCQKITLVSADGPSGSPTWSVSGPRTPRCAWTDSTS
jgi:transposase